MQNTSVASPPRRKPTWDRRAAQFPGDQRAQLRAWLKEMADHIGATDDRGCALANAAVELPERDHPARRVIETFKTAQRARLTELCVAAGLTEPDMLADELFLLLEGARVSAQCMGRDGLGARLVRMGEAMIAAHQPERQNYAGTARIISQADAMDAPWVPAHNRATMGIHGDAHDRSPTRRSCAA